MTEKIFYSMGEVAEMLDVRQSVIRHWEREFSMLRPTRNNKGNRLFSPEDVTCLKTIHHLVRERGMRLEGAKKALKQMMREGRSASRDAELLERLQRIRAQLMEVREELKAREGELVDDGFAEEPAGSNAAGSLISSGGKRAAADGVLVAAAAVQTEEAVVRKGACGGEGMNTVVPGNFEAVDDAVVGISGTDKAEGSVGAIADGDVVAPTPRKGRKAVVKIVDEAPGDVAGETGTAQLAPGMPVRRPRRKKEDAENKELFAFYEQSLF